MTTFQYRPSAHNNHHFFIFKTKVNNKPLVNKRSLFWGIKGEHRLDCTYIYSQTLLKLSYLIHLKQLFGFNCRNNVKYGFRFRKTLEKKKQRQLSEHSTNSNPESGGDQEEDFPMVRPEANFTKL